MRPLRSLFRILLFLVLTGATTAWLLAALTWNRVHGLGDQEKRNLVHRHFLKYLGRVHSIMGIRVVRDGTLPSAPAVLMGNHRSYVDSILFPVQFPVTFVARAETKSWPIIGWGASLIGTIWVDRKNKASRRATRQEVRQRLEQGMGIVIFPEGTTHLGPDLLEYRPGMFYTCAEEGFPIVPVALEYRDAGIAWVGDTWFIPHAFHHFGAKHIDIAVRFGDPVVMDDAEKLREHVRDWTAKNCLELRAQFDHSP